MTIRTFLRFLLVASLSAVFLSACGGGGGKSTPTACTTNVTGCDNPDLQHSCAAANFCYATREGCIDSNECPVNDEPETPAANCVTNVDGCPDAGLFSCPAALSCYTSQEQCIASNECN